MERFPYLILVVQTVTGILRYIYTFPTTSQRQMLLLEYICLIEGPREFMEVGILHFITGKKEKRKTPIASSPIVMMQVHVPRANSLTPSSRPIPFHHSPAQNIDQNRHKHKKTKTHFKRIVCRPFVATLLPPRK
jgi:hypothetical protein